MKTMKCWLCVLLALVLCFGAAVSALAYGEKGLTAEEKAAELTKLGLFKGKADKDGNVRPALEDEANRAEAATMLIRLMGKEEKAAAQYSAGALSCIFDDVPGWAAANVAWLYEGSYINGMGGTTFGSKRTVTAQQYATMVLRALGYNETDGDFAYKDALSFAVSKGLLTEAQSQSYQNDFRREGMVEMSYNALGLKMKFSSFTLMEKLSRDGVFSGVDYSVGKTPALSLTLKYSAGGKTNPTYFEEKAFGNAVCGDVDGDGKLEIVFGIRSIFCIDAASGKLKWRVPVGHQASEGLDPVANTVGEAFLYAPPFQILDYDGDGRQEIFTVTNVAGSTVCNIAVYDGNGNYKAHWSTEKRVWAACVDDLDGDGKCEVVIGLGNTTAEYNKNVHTVYLYNNDGSVRWSKFCSYGTFSDSIAAVDLDGDGKKEIVMLYDEKQIVAYRADGTEVTASKFGGKKWSQIPFFEGVDEKKAYTTRETSIGLMGTHGGLVADDMDGDGKQELVFTALFVLMSVVEKNMASGNGVNFDDSARYFGPFILNTDRTRYTNASKGYDWSVIPQDVGPIVALDDPALDNPSLEPTTADLDGDGEKEILYSSNDGRVHCFSLDGIEHGAWPYTLDSRSSAVLAFASQPVAADLNGDGKQEVVFATYTQSDQLSERGSLYILDNTGKLLAQTVLPPMFAQTADTVYPNGSRTAPIIADVDGDGRPEIAVATYSCGVCVYDVN